MGLNKVMLIGNLGADPEVRYTPDGTCVCNFSLATNEKWKDKNTGEQREKTEWHRIVAWRRLAEICGEYLVKGKQIYVEGKLQTRSWETDGGDKRYTTEIVINEMQMLGGAPGGNQGRPRDEQPYGGQHPGQNQSPPDDDIPF